MHLSSLFAFALHYSSVEFLGLSGFVYSALSFSGIAAAAWWFRKDSSETSYSPNSTPTAAESEPVVEPAHEVAEAIVDDELGKSKRRTRWKSPPEMASESDSSESGEAEDSIAVDNQALELEKKKVEKLSSQLKRAERELLSLKQALKSPESNARNRHVLLEKNKAIVERNKALEKLRKYKRKAEELERLVSNLDNTEDAIEDPTLVITQLGESQDQLRAMEAIQTELHHSLDIANRENRQFRAMLEQAEIAKQQVEQQQDDWEQRQRAIESQLKESLHENEQLVGQIDELQVTQSNELQEHIDRAAFARKDLLEEQANKESLANQMNSLRDESQKLLTKFNESSKQQKDKVEQLNKELVKEREASTQHTERIDELQKDCQQLKSIVESQALEISVAAEEKADWQAKETQQNSVLSGLQQQLAEKAELDGELAKLTAELDRERTEQQEMASRLEAANEAVAEHQRGLEKLEAELVERSRVQSDLHRQLDEKAELEAKLAKLTAELDQERAGQQEMASRLEVANEAVTEHQRGLEKLEAELVERSRVHRDQVAEYQSQLEDACKAKSELNVTIQTHEKQIASQSEEIEAQSEQIETQREQITAQLERIAALEKQIELASARIDSQTMELENSSQLQELIDNLESRIATMQQDADEGQADRARLQSELTAVQNQWEQLKSERDGEASAIKQLNITLEESIQLRQSLEKRCGELEVQIQAKQKERDVQEEQLETFREELASRDRQIEALQNAEIDGEEKVESNDELQREHESLQESIAELIQEREEMQLRLGEAERNGSQLEEERQKLEQERDTYKQKRRKVVRKYRRLNERYEAIQLENSRASKGFSSLEQKILALEQQNGELVQQLGLAKSQDDESTDPPSSENRRLRKAVEDLGHRLAESRDRYKKLAVQYRKTRSRYKRYKDRLVSYKNLLERFRGSGELAELERNTDDPVADNHSEV